jgi:hypothetical protein
MAQVRRGDVLRPQARLERQQDDDPVAEREAVVFANISQRGAHLALRQNFRLFAHAHAADFRLKFLYVQFYRQFGPWAMPAGAGSGSNLGLPLFATQQREFRQQSLQSWTASQHLPDRKVDSMRANPDQVRLSTFRAAL